MPIPVEGQSVRDEDQMKYVNTSSFDMDLENGNYEVTATLTNPSKDPVTAVIDVEDILRYTSGDNAADFATVELEGCQTKTVTFTIALTDGQLTMRFAQDSDADSAESAPTKTICIKSISVLPLAQKEAGNVPTIFIAGDSTVQTYEDTSYRTSWAQMLYQMFGGDTFSVIEETSTGYAKYTTDTVNIENYARDARSTVSFEQEGRLNKILLNVKREIMYSHNSDTMMITGREPIVRQR